MFLVVFRSRKRSEIDAAAYAAEGERMQQLARAQPGYLSFKSYQAQDGEYVDLSEWTDEESARNWGRNIEHLQAQARGRSAYYENYTLFACGDVRVHRFGRKDH